MCGVLLMGARDERDDLLHTFVTLGGLDDSRAAHVATQTVIEGVEKTVEQSLRWRHVSPDKRKGYVAEEIEAAELRKEAKRAGNSKDVRTTSSVGRPHDPVDIEVTDNGRVTKRIQVKDYQGKDAATRAANAICEGKYSEVDEFRVPKEIKDDVVRKLEEKAHKAGTAEDRKALLDLTKKVVPMRSSRLEIAVATKAPRLYAVTKSAKAIGEEAIPALGSAAVDVVEYSVASEAVDSLCDVLNGSADAERSLRRLRDSTVRSLKSQVVYTGTSIGMKHGIAAGTRRVKGEFKHVFESVSRSKGLINQDSIVGAMTDFAIHTYDTLRRTCQGEITVEDAVQQILTDAPRIMVRNGFNLVMKKGLLLLGAGPAGAASLLVFMSYAAAKKIILGAIQEAAKAKEEADEVQRMSELICAEFEKRRIEFERQLSEALHSLSPFSAVGAHQVDRCRTEGMERNHP
jgi:hypothetical protein